MSDRMMRASHIITFIDPELKSATMISTILSRVVYNYGKEIGALYKNQFIFQLNIFDSNCHEISEIVDKTLGMRVNFNFRPKSCYNIDSGSERCYNSTQFKVCVNAVHYSDKPLSLILIRSSLSGIINQQYNYITNDEEDRSSVMSSEEIRCYKRAANLINVSKNAEIPVFVYVYDDPMLSYTLSNKLELIGIESALRNASIELTDLYNKKSS